MKHTSEFTSTLAIGKTVTGISRGPASSGTYETEWSGVYEGIQPSEWTGDPVHCFRSGIVGVTPQSHFAIPVSHFAGRLCLHESRGDSECLLDVSHTGSPDHERRLHSDLTLLWDGQGYLCNLDGTRI